MKYILILGANSDVGIELAKLYASNGNSLYLVSRKLDRINELSISLKKKYNVDVKCFQLDILNLVMQKEFCEKLDQKPHGIIISVGELINTNDLKSNDQLLRIINTNFTYIAHFLNYFIPYLEKNMSGFIIGLTSVAGERGRIKNYVYGSAKSGFITYLSGLRSHLHRFNVHVMTVIPGYMKTKMNQGVKTSKLITVSSEKAAKIIFKSQNRKKNIVYVSNIWRFIMFIIKLIPENIFKRLNF